jgi:hypothetical protein
MLNMGSISNGPFKFTVEELKISHIRKRKDPAIYEGNYWLFKKTIIHSFGTGLQETGKIFEGAIKHQITR